MLEIDFLTNCYCRIHPLQDCSAEAVELDMGCGKGSYALQLAARFPLRLILASDVMLGRLRKLARKAGRQGCANLRILRASSLDLVGYQLPDSVVRRAHILCPDPWPKKRHRRRRLLTADFLGRLARILEPDGTLHIATDDRVYLSQIEALLDRLPAFEADRRLERIQDIMDLRTDFEEQWLEQGREVPHLAYRICKSR